MENFLDSSEEEGYQPKYNAEEDEYVPASAISQ